MYVCMYVCRYACVVIAGVAELVGVWFLQRTGGLKRKKFSIKGKGGGPQPP